VKRNLLIVMVILSISVGYIQGQQIKNKDYDSKSVVQEQLRGIRSITLLVYVDYEIPDYSTIKDEIYSLCAEKLKNEGLDLNAEQTIYLCIEIDSYPITIEGLNDFILLRVKTELLDEARLVRDPNLRNPHGYVTWSNDWVFISSLESLRSSIKEEVLIRLEIFCIDRKGAERFVSK